MNCKVDHLEQKKFYSTISVLIKNSIGIKKELVDLDQIFCYLVRFSSFLLIRQTVSGLQILFNPLFML